MLTVHFLKTIGYFLSNRNTNGKILSELVVEAIKLLGQAGFFVHAVTSDGATWNRNFWKRLGVKKNEISCPHPFNDESYLHMISDFPHLMKCMRNSIVLQEFFWVSKF